ncbi:hypothetical protein QZJ86_03405 [Methylomonas montana]|uniref:hypothetical protein n=1 Tax=Methylomonas montana TaxID=3058963 RepID=UPI00265AF0F2|nr:hypothetical protein [Methylomonas montana]WKJ91187.1 hypothetical protein QZJ86_03405 [Methylomonas montana]
MKTKSVVFALLMACAPLAQGSDRIAQGLPFFDIVLYRPLGLIATVAGSAIFAATSPLTAFANISPPHDAFEIAAGMLVVAPAKFTFDRPLGVMFPDEDGEYRRH